MSHDRVPTVTPQPFGPAVQDDVRAPDQFGRPHGP